MKSNIVYYIYAPRWRDNAAGIRVLHYLCHEINLSGNYAYLIIQNPSKKYEEINKDLKTPILDIKQEKLHRENKFKQIVIYSETVPGNPINGKNIIRYLLNYPGALGGPKFFPQNELIVSYTENIAKSVKSSKFTLFIPAVRSGELKIRSKKVRNLNLVYAGKYRAFIGTPIFNYGEKVKEIYRDGPLKQERSEVLNLLASADKIYCWENSTIATEAILLNTICVFIPNPFLGEIIASKELGPWGYCIDKTEEGIKFARSTLKLAKENFLKVESQTPLQIRKFLNFCESHFHQEKISPGRIRVPKNTFIISRHRIKLFINISRFINLKTAIKVVREFFLVRFYRK